MELKHIKAGVFRLEPSLLIVPYGIETRLFIWFGGLSMLLIVPYGIETLKNTFSQRQQKHF